MNDSTAPATPRVPVICDKCRAAGMAGDEAFAAIPDLLDFEPVPRRAHHNGWSPEHQRAFIAALAITGSPRQAARHVGRAQYGAEQLRTAKGGRGFAAAWDAAMELARDRELMRLHDNLGELARKTEEAHAAAKEAGRLVPPDEQDDGEDDGSYERHIEEVRQRLFEKLQRLRRRELIEEIIPFPEKREAWVVLYGAEEIEEIESASADANSLSPDEGEGAQGSGPSGWSDPCAGEGEPSPSPASASRHSRESGNLPSSSPQAERRPSASKRPGPRVRRI